jgi:phosphoribosylformylglycinamidine synthase
MGGGAVSSVIPAVTAVQLSLMLSRNKSGNAEKSLQCYPRTGRTDANPVISIHDHGAGGHLNCLSELVESAGGKIDLSKLPVGDPTLSARADRQ